jgi:hypothetical protein
MFASSHHINQVRVEERVLFMSPCIISRRLDGTCDRIVASMV